MPKGFIRSLDRTSQQEQKIVKLTLIPRDFAFTVDGLSGTGFGSVAIGDFPEGNILFLGAVAYISTGGDGTNPGLVDTWFGDYGIGTTAADDGTITAGDVDIIDSTTLPAATAEVSPRTKGTGATRAIFNNTDGSLELNLNVLVNDGGISADGVPFTATGDVFISYIVLGDD